MTSTTNISNPDFQRIVEMIQAAQGRALAVVYTELVTLHWNVGEDVSQKVSPVATQLQQSDYQQNTKVSTLLTQIVMSAFGASAVPDTQSDMISEQSFIKQKIEELKSHESCVSRYVSGQSWVKNYLKERSLKSYIIHHKS